MSTILSEEEKKGYIEALLKIKEKAVKGKNVYLVRKINLILGIRPLDSISGNY